MLEGWGHIYRCRSGQIKVIWTTSPKARQGAGLAAPPATDVGSAESHTIAPASPAFAPRSGGHPCRATIAGAAPSRSAPTAIGRIFTRPGRDRLHKGFSEPRNDAVSWLAISAEPTPAKPGGVWVAGLCKPGARQDWQAPRLTRRRCEVCGRAAPRRAGTVAQLFQAGHDAQGLTLAGRSPHL